MRLNKFYKPALLFFCIIYLSAGSVTQDLVYAKSKTEELAESIESILSNTNCAISIQVASADKYDLIYEMNPREKMIPASITKLITASAAIDILGINYDFKTIIYTDDNNIADGVIDGNLYIKGYGDPDLNSSDIIYLAELVSKKGIIEITGNVVYDESYLDENHYSIADYYAGDTKKGYWPYVSGLNLNKNGGGYDPASSAGSLLAENLISHGVNVGGIVIAGMTPSSSKEIAEVSHSIFDVLSHMNKESDNHSAITVFKVIGAKALTPPGSIEKGEEAIIKFLTSIGNPRNNFEILEGSGLSRFNVVTSDLYMRTLKYMYDEEKSFDNFYNSLAIAGMDGTLKNRMIGTEAENNVHAKTGTLNSVSSLCGYAVSRDSELLIFYITMNGFGGGANKIRYQQDQICELLCQFSRK